MAEDWFARIACLLRSSTVSSCTCCIDLGFKLQGHLLQADCVEHATMAFKVSKSRHKRKPLFKTLKLLALRSCCAVPVLQSPALGFSNLKKSELQTYRYIDTRTHSQTDYHMPSAHVHQCISASHASGFIYLTDKLAATGCSLYTGLLCMKSVAFVDGYTELNYNVYRTNYVSVYKVMDH